MISQLADVERSVTGFRGWKGDGLATLANLLMLGLTNAEIGAVLGRTAIAVSRISHKHREHLWGDKTPAEIAACRRVLRRSRLEAIGMPDADRRVGNNGNSRAGARRPPLPPRRCHGLCRKSFTPRHPTNFVCAPCAERGRHASVADAW